MASGIAWLGYASLGFWALLGLFTALNLRTFRRPRAATPDKALTALGAAREHRAIERSPEDRPVGAVGGER